MQPAGSVLIANATQQRIDSTSAAVGTASLPTGERVQIVMPPATSAGCCVAIAIRRLWRKVWSIEELASRGIFRRAKPAGKMLDAIEQELRLYCGDAISRSAFMRLAVHSRKNIVVSGPTDAPAKPLGLKP